MKKEKLTQEERAKSYARCGLKKRILNNCQNGSCRNMEFQLEFYKSVRQSILPTILSQEETIDCFIDAIKEYKNSIM